MADTSSQNPGRPNPPRRRPYEARFTPSVESGVATFDALREANLARMPQLRNKHGMLAHATPTGSDVAPAQWLQALVGEIGEYANLRKKFERGDISEAQFKGEAAKELADVQCYLDVLALQLGIDLGQATMRKFNEVSERMGSAVRLLGNRWVYVRAPVQVSLF